MNSYLVWYSYGPDDEQAPRIVTALSSDHVEEQLREQVEDFNKIISIEECMMEL